MMKKKRRARKSPMESVEISFPQTPEEFDSLVQTVVSHYGLPSLEHAAAVIAGRIMHAPVDQATTTYQYLGNCVKRNIAYQVAHAQSKKIEHKMQVDHLVNVIKMDPTNQQALDELQKAVSDGSSYAQAQMNELNETVFGGAHGKKESSGRFSASGMQN